MAFMPPYVLSKCFLIVENLCIHQDDNVACYITFLYHSMEACGDNENNDKMWGYFS